MKPSAGTNPWVGNAHAELRPLVENVDFVPERVPRTEKSAARKLLESDGGVILTGWPVEPDSVVDAASAMLGTRLRELERLRERTTVDTAITGEVPSQGLLHRDWGDSVVEIQERPVRLRIPDPDYVLIFCAAPAPVGGESVVVDGYRLVERLRNSAPELYEFLTTVDVDINAGYERSRMPRVCRMVEWTRGGRMIVRVAEGAGPAPHETRRDDHQCMINSYKDVLATAADQIRADTTLAPGEVLIVDNYRCLHGVRHHQGRRTTYVLRCKSKDA